MAEQGGFTAEAQGEVLDSLGFGTSSATDSPALEETTALASPPSRDSVSFTKQEEKRGQEVCPYRPESDGETREERVH